MWIQVNVLFRDEKNIFICSLFITIFICVCFYDLMVGTIN